MATRTQISPAAGRLRDAGRVERDRRFAAIRQPDSIRPITDELLKRAKAGGALSFVLTGSTALEARTQVSDLDFYIVGAKPELPETDEELDVYTVDHDEFKWRLLAGDDYAHWTVRFGLVLHDRGPMNWAAQAIERDDLWPDPTAKVKQAKRSLQLASAILESGDHDAAVEQTRVAFSLVARWMLLAKGDFPLARSHLPDQIAGTRFEWLGTILSETIAGDPSDEQLFEAVNRLIPLVESGIEGPGLSPLGKPRQLRGRRTSLRSQDFGELSKAVFGRSLSIQETFEVLGLDQHWDKAAKQPPGATGGTQARLARRG